MKKETASLFSSLLFFVIMISFIAPIFMMALLYFKIYDPLRDDGVIIENFQVKVLILTMFSALSGSFLVYFWVKNWLRKKAKN